MKTTYKLLKDLPFTEKWTIFTAEWEMEDWNINNQIEPMIVNGRKDELIWEWFEEIKEVKSIYELEMGDNYYCIIDIQVIKTEVCEMTQEEYDKCLLQDHEKQAQFWNAFLTKEEAETELEKRKSLAAFKKYCFDNPSSSNAEGTLNRLEYYEQDAMNYLDTI